MSRGCPRRDFLYGATQRGAIIGIRIELTKKRTNPERTPHYRNLHVLAIQVLQLFIQ